MRNNEHIDRPLLITVLCFPGTVATLDEAAWGLLIRQARNANVLGQMLSAVEAHVSCDQWPLRAQQSFLAEKNVADHRYASLLWEIDVLSRALAPGNIRPVLLNQVHWQRSWFAGNSRDCQGTPGSGHGGK